MPNKALKTTLLFYVVNSIFLAIYSYSQIDLNLTLSSNYLYQKIQQGLIYLGYFNRLLSALIYLILILSLFIFYSLLLYFVKKMKFSEKNLWFFISLISLILVFSYPAFSHDIFNYMFDARIITKYSLSPYLFRALDFPSDPWIRFMHWTHRYYPYGPVWLMISLIPSFLGFGKFTLTLLNFKIMFFLFHLGNVYLIKKISEKISPALIKKAVVFYAFNPLILIESVLSPHNEVLMFFFFLLAVYLLIFDRKILSFLSILTSGGIKFLTFLAMLGFIIFKFDKKNIEKILKLSLILVCFGLIFIIWRREFYPWYFILPLGIFSFFVKQGSALRLLFLSLSLGLILRYLPFVYYGEYSQNTINLTNIITLGAVGIVLIFLFFKKWKKI